MCNYVEFHTHWIFNNDLMIIKPNFNENFNSIKFNNSKITSLLFSGHTNIHDIEINKNNYDKGHKYIESNDSLGISPIVFIYESNFNCTVDNLPSSLIYLTFGNKFNCTVDNLPSSLLNLTFGNKFNQIVDNLPSSLLNLTFGYEFNQIVDNLPLKLSVLTLGKKFNQSLNNLPCSIISIKFINQYDFCQTKYDFNKKLNYLPNNINSICQIVFTK